MNPKELSFESVQKEYVQNMKHAKNLLEAVPWCCNMHKLLTKAALDSIKGSKDRSLAALREGKIEEATFIKLISMQNHALDQLSISMENICVFAEPQINVGSVGAS